MTIFCSSNLYQAVIFEVSTSHWLPEIYSEPLGPAELA